MITWILYDIVNDRARTKVAKFCKQAGLYRVQYSVFVGTLETNAQDELVLRISDEITEETDKVYIFPISKGNLKNTVLLGQAFDKKLVSDEVKALFL